MTGVVALIRARFPDLDAANVINKLIKTATPAGGSVPNPTYGYGIINADKALTAKVATVSANPLGGAPSSGPSGRPSGPSSAPSSSPDSSPGASSPG